MRSAATLVLIATFLIEACAVTGPAQAPAQSANGELAVALFLKSQAMDASNDPTNETDDVVKLFEKAEGRFEDFLRK